jgi:hypothetical protein
MNFQCHPPYTEENDNFQFKLTIFTNICQQADIPHEAALKAFPIMLKGLALDYYYSNFRSWWNATFEQVCSLMESYFEGAEYKRGVQMKFNAMTLKSVMAKPENQDKAMEDCLQVLIRDLRHLQHGLDAEFRSDKFLLNKLILACQDVPACHYACFKPC